MPDHHPHPPHDPEHPQHECCCKVVQAGPPPDQVCYSSEVIGLQIHLQTLNENLDINTSVFATVRRNGGVVARDIPIAHGEVEEYQYHPVAYIPFNRSVFPATGLTLEITHPGIPNNQEPHWRMRFTLLAVTRDGHIRYCGVVLESSTIYDIGEGGHLNFVDGGRSSGEMPFLIYM